MERKSNRVRAVTTEPSRRSFLRDAMGAGASLGLGALVAGCATESCPAPTAEAAVDTTPDGFLDVVAAKMPYRQDDPAWGADLMWDRDLVIQADTDLNGDTKANAESLLREFADGNSIGNEGCQLTCFAMILRLLAPDTKPAWTPKTLNQAAQDLYYYTLCGLSLTTLYADLVSEVTNGEIQLCAKEEYLSGVESWPREFANTSALVRAYRSLPPKKRSNFLVMLKTGTYDDTVASHYVLLHPNESESPDHDDVEILDPAKPSDETKATWRLSDSAQVITGDPDIAKGWADGGIQPTQIGGVWVFSRWSASHDRSLLAPLIRAWADELSTPAS